MTSQSQRSLLQWMKLATLVALAMLAYLPALQHSGFIWDDNDYVTDNATLRSMAGLAQIWFSPGATYQYYPLVHSTYWAEYHLWGLWAPGYRATNIALHAGNAVLVWVFLRMLSVPGALLAAAIFAVHPMHVESVAWITERKNVLSTLFYLVSLISFMRSQDGMDPHQSNRRLYVVSLVAYLAALLSKTVTCTLPAAILIVSWYKHGRLSGGVGLRTIPFFVLGVAFALVTVWMEHSHVGASGTEWSYSISQRLLIAGRALWFYPAKLMYPATLVFFYPKWTPDVGSPMQWSYPVTFALLLVLLIGLRHRIGRGAAAAVLFYSVTIAPALGFVNIYPMRYTFTADHYVYVASLGWIVLVAAGATRLLSATDAKPVRALGAAAAFLGLTVLSLLTWQRTNVLCDEERLWRDTIAKNPQSEVAHNNLGNLLTTRGHHTEALQHYRAVLAMNPDDDSAHLNAGLVLVAMDRNAEAVHEFREAVRVRPRDHEAHFELGRTLERSGETTAALASYRQSLQIKPDFTHARLALTQP